MANSRPVLFFAKLDKFYALSPVTTPVRSKGSRLNAVSLSTQIELPDEPYHCSSSQSNHEHDSSAAPSRSVRLIRADIQSPAGMRYTSMAPGYLPAKLITTSFFLPLLHSAGVWSTVM